MSREAGEFDHHSGTGGIFTDWAHDAANPADRLFFGRCTECGWRDPCDHVLNSVAETELANHKHVGST